MTVHSVTIHGANNTRRTFLSPVVHPLLNDEKPPSTLGDVMSTLQSVTTKLERLDIFKPDPRIMISDVDPASDPSATPTDVAIDIKLKELGRLKVQTGTDIGNSEGSAYGSLLWRNMFGGAEMLSLSASAGTRTRSAYSATLSVPVFSNPDMRVALDAMGSSTQKPWASHEEVLRGGNLRTGWLSKLGDLHAVEYSGMWRQITGLSGGASSSVRAEAGDSVKSSIRHIFERDRRDSRLLPQSGYQVKSTLELAGIGPLGGDVAFAKGEVDLGGAIPLGASGRSGVSVGAGLRLGAMYPLPMGFDFGGKAKPSRIADRFLLGGPNDVRGFKLGGLGPHDGPDAVGGDVYAAGGINVLLPVPYKGADSPLRFQVFLNGGRLAALRSKGKDKQAVAEGMGGRAVRNAMARAMREITAGPPSLAVGLGLVYAHPMARFEMNFGVPLAMARGEQATKGLQFGVGINFM
jgi:outer membrane protein insertion porin family